MDIRLYQSKDYPMLKSWWERQGAQAAPESMIPVDSSYIFSFNDVPTLFISLYLTNNPHVCFAENFVGNPDKKGALRKSAMPLVCRFIEGMAKARGFKNLQCTSVVEKLSAQYAALGFRETKNVSLFSKEL